MEDIYRRHLQYIYTLKIAWLF